MENTSEGNKNKIVLGDFFWGVGGGDYNCTIDKMDWNSGNKKTKTL